MLTSEAACSKERKMFSIEINFFKLFKNDFDFIRGYKSADL